MARPRRSEPTRQRLLEHGVALLLQQGFHGTGLKALLDRAEVPKGSFYNYFGSKEEFGAAVIRHYARVQDLQLDQAVLEAQGNAVNALRTFFQRKTVEFEHAAFQGGCLVGNLAGELDEGGPLRLALSEVLRGWLDRFRTVLEYGQGQNSVRDDIAAAELADFLLDAWQGALLRMRVDRSAKPLHQFMRLVLDDMVTPRQPGQP